MNTSSMAPVGGAHAVAHAAALEGRPGGAGADDQPVPVAEDHLAVGADVDEQGELLGARTSPSEMTPAVMSPPT